MKDKTTAGFLALIFGGLGFHKFYLNRPFQGLMYLFFCWTFIPVAIGFLEAIVYFFNSKEWFDNKYNPNTIRFVRDENPSLELEKMAGLYEKGYLTKEEFESKKEIILRKIS